MCINVIREYAYEYNAYAMMSIACFNKNFCKDMGRRNEFVRT